MPSFWNVRNLNVVVDGLSEFLDFSMEPLTSGGLIKLVSSSLESMELFVVKSSSPCSGVSSVPSGALKIVVLSSNIFQLVFNLLHSMVIHVKV